MLAASRSSAARAGMHRRAPARRPTRAPRAGRNYGNRLTGVPAVEAPATYRSKPPTRNHSHKHADRLTSLPDSSEDSRPLTAESHTQPAARPDSHTLSLIARGTAVGGSGSIESRLVHPAVESGILPADPRGPTRRALSVRKNCRSGRTRSPMSSSGTRATGGFRYLGDSAGGGVLAAGAAFGVGERAELAGPVVPDRVDPDDLAVPG
jgi:hypothetical protein